MYGCVGRDEAWAKLLNQSLLLVPRLFSQLGARSAFFRSWNIYHFLLLDVIGEVFGDDVGVGQQDIPDGLEEGETETVWAHSRTEKHIPLAWAWQHAKITFANLFI